MYYPELGDMYLKQGIHHQIVIYIKLSKDQEPTCMCINYISG